jgi:hypothetical protein
MTKIDVRKNWLLGQAVVEYEQEFEITALQLSRFADGFLRSVLPGIPRQETSDGVLRDYKGRNPGDLLLPDMPVAIGNELFALWGDWAIEVEEGETTWEPFEIAIATPFHEFEGTHHITHALEERRLGPLPSWLPTSLLGYAVPLRARALRFGLEGFRSVFTFASVGYVPTVVDSFLFDVTGERGMVRWTHECKMREVTLDPCGGDSVFARCISLIENVTGTSVRDAYRDAVSSRAR